MVRSVSIKKLSSFNGNKYYKKNSERKQSRVLNGKEIKHQTDNPTKNAKCMK